jgi:hypothetical protein
MKTEDFIDMLATGITAVEKNVAARRYAMAIVFGALASTLLMVASLGINPNIAQAALLAKFWIKLGFVACLAGASLFVALRLSKPGLRLGMAPSALIAPVAVMWVFALFVMGMAEPAQRMKLLLGETWIVCPILIVMLSAPIFAMVIWAMKGLAPTRLRLAGASAGLLSGATGALVYCLHCPEMEAPFLAVWYVLGMLIPTAIGALSAHRLLRW